jgi:lipoate-protein ligase A
MEYPHAKWRLVSTPAAMGAWNMALDEAILEATARQEAPPTLRLYAWSPPCLSLGYAQALCDVDQAELRLKGWQLVRRPTGGRAILHADELTYSVCGPADEPRLAGSVLESYRVLAQALLWALQKLGIPAQAQERPKTGNPGSKAAGEPNPVCFETPSDYEITVAGKKLIGSAQARRKEGVLQHGSLPLSGDLTRITQVLSFNGSGGYSETMQRQAASRLLERATTVEACLGSRISWDLAAQAFSEAFCEKLDLELQPGEPTQAELKHAEILVVEKFGNPAWTGAR